MRAAGRREASRCGLSPAPPLRSGPERPGSSPFSGVFGPAFSDAVERLGLPVSGAGAGAGPPAGTRGGSRGRGRGGRWPACWFGSRRGLVAVTRSVGPLKVGCAFHLVEAAGRPSWVCRGCASAQRPTGV